MRLPALGLGTAPLGGLFASVSDRAADETVAAALDSGVRLLDTAPLYGNGVAERRVGEALRHCDRERVVVSTKVGFLLRPGAPVEPSQIEGGTPLYRDTSGLGAVRDYSRDGIRRSLEESLVRLGLDRIDLAHVHDPDDHLAQALDESLPALHELRAEGLVGAIGAGMNHTAGLARLVRDADLDCVLVAGRYTLLDQGALEELLPLCEARGVAVIVGGVFNSGVLADPSPGARYDYRPVDRAVLARVRAIQRVCVRHGTSLRHAALSFPTGHPAVRCVLVGARSAAEVREAAAMAAEPVPPSLWDDLRARRLLAEDAPVPESPVRS